MEKTATYSEESIAKNTLVINKKLATGKFTVYHAHCPSKNADYALKVFPRDSYGAAQYKREKLMSKFNHPNIIQYIPIKCHTSSFYALVTEYAPYGDFFDAVTKGVLNNEVLVRTYFHQLIEGLEYIHSQGVAHLDLKLENLLLASNFTLKIIDFDQSQPLTEEGIKSKGTMCYRAPEVTNSTCKDFLAADIYSAGIVLYVLKAKEYPFVEKQTRKGWELMFYDQFVEKNADYWKWKNATNEAKVPFGEDFVELLNAMVCPEPEKRLKLSDIKESKWYKGPVLDAESLEIEMKARWESVMKKQKKPQPMPTTNGRVERPNRGRVESQ